MSIEAMKRIKALLQDGDKIDSHTISAVVAECDAVILTQQPATGEPVYWEWRHLSTHPDTVDFGQWSEWKRVEARSAIHTIDDALAEFRAYIAQGYKYELRPLYTHPAPSEPADVVRDAERYRWLRDHDHWPAPFSSSQEPEPVRGLDLDAAIDAAMLAAKKASA